MLSIVDLLSLKGLDLSNKIKFVRHQDSRCDLNELLRAGHFETYQSFQGKPIFDCDYIVSFMGMNGSRARFLGVYQVNGYVPLAEAPPFPESPIMQMVKDTDVFYDLQEADGFDDLKGRVVIEWGKGTRSWVQWLSDREVIEILPQGHVKPFPGYLDFVLTYDELQAICCNPSANQEWHRALSAVAGIYLIMDQSSGLQYIGSAYGKNGLLGRWINYAHSGHGGNVKLRDALELGDLRSCDLRFSILRTLPKTLTMTEVIEYEARYKEKLGTRAFGLNLN